jgi:hypothetical protein
MNPCDEHHLHGLEVGFLRPLRGSHYIENVAGIPVRLRGRACEYLLQLLRRAMFGKP